MMMSGFRESSIVATTSFFDRMPWKLTTMTLSWLVTGSFLPLVVAWRIGDDVAMGVDATPGEDGAASGDKGRVLKEFDCDGWMVLEKRLEVKFGSPHVQQIHDTSVLLRALYTLELMPIQSM